MREATLTHGKVEILFYEPEGLLLAAGLLSVAGTGPRYLLVFQLCYLGDGEIAVDVRFERSIDNAPCMPAFFAVDLLGSARGRSPSTWVNSFEVCEEVVNCRLVVCGESSVDESMRGELIANVSGRIPLLTARSRATVTDVDTSWLSDVDVMPYQLQADPSWGNGARGSGGGRGGSGAGRGPTYLAREEPW